CEHCGQPIPPERLLVLPEARLCVRCKNAEEKLARRRVAA
ncbi:MAG: TraR/DksA C4-type zinc finger protein, partial [Anaerolineae bacterium]